MSAAEFNAVAEVVHRYFEGLYDGDVEKLRAVFDPESTLQAPGYRKSRDEWLEGVARRASPRDRGEPFAFGVRSIEVSGVQAVAKLDAPMLGHRYTDHLTLLREGGGWRIVNKTFADEE